MYRSGLTKDALTSPERTTLVNFKGRKGGRSVVVYIPFQTQSYNESGINTRKKTYRERYIHTTILSYSALKVKHFICKYIQSGIYTTARLNPKVAYIPFRISHKLPFSFFNGIYTTLGLA